NEDFRMRKRGRCVPHVLELGVDRIDETVGARAVTGDSSQQARIALELRDAVYAKRDRGYAGCTNAIGGEPIVFARVQHDEIGMHGEHGFDVWPQRESQTLYLGGGFWKDVELRPANDAAP